MCICRGVRGVGRSLSSYYTYLFPVLPPSSYAWGRNRKKVVYAGRGSTRKGCEMMEQAKTSKQKPLAKRPRGRSWKGVHPTNGQEIMGRWVYDGGYSEVGVAYADDVEWVVYERMNKSADWVDVRVIARHKAPNKASYWLGWNSKEARLANGKDAWTMAQHRPGLVTAVSDLMTAYFDAYSLLS